MKITMQEQRLRRYLKDVFDIRENGRKGDKVLKLVTEMRIAIINREREKCARLVYGELMTPVGMHIADKIRLMK